MSHGSFQSQISMPKSASASNLQGSKPKGQNVQAGFHRDTPFVEGRRERTRLRRMSRSVEPFRVHALPFGDHLAINHDSLFQAMIHPTEMHRLLETAEEQKRFIEGVALGGLEDLEISALTPHGLMGFECFVDMEGSLQIRTESLPSAPHLIDGPKGSNSQYYMEKAACLSTPFMLETEGSNLKLLNMQEVQRLAMETETVVQMRVAEELSSVGTFKESGLSDSPQRRPGHVRSFKRRPSDEKLPDVKEIKAALKLDADVPKLPLPDEERERISSVYASHDFEAEPPNMLTLDDDDIVDQLLELHDAPEHDSLSLTVATVSMDEEDLPPAVAAQARAQEAAARLWPADVAAQFIATGLDS